MHASGQWTEVNVSPEKSIEHSKVVKRKMQDSVRMDSLV